MNTEEKIKNITIQPEIPLIEALKLMDKLDKKLLIVKSDDKFIGLLSIGDIQRAIIKNIQLNTQVSNILRENIKVASEEDDFEKIKNIMFQYRTECLPVLNKNNELVTVFFWEDIFTNRSISLNKDINIPLVIMAGGKGTRLKPFSNIIPKPLFPFGEKTIIETIIEKFINYNIPVVYISVNHKSEMIKQYLSENISPDINIQYIDESIPLGTAGSLHFLKNKISSDFFVSNCDIIIEQDYNEIYNYHKENNNDLTVVAALKHFKIPYGTIETGENGLLLNIIEKPEFTHKINSGMYILKPELLSLIPENKHYHITELIETISKNGSRVGVFPVSEKSWIDIGVWEEYKKNLGDFDY